MPWVKIDDKWSNHPKLITVGPLGKTLYMDALCYASQYLTDGFIPELVSAQLCFQFLEFENSGNLKDSEDPITWLCNQELWIKDESGRGYWIHDYLEFNPSRAQVEAERESAKERMRRTREQNNNPKDVRPKFNRSSDSPVPVPHPVVPTEPNGSLELETPPTPSKGKKRNVEEAPGFVVFYDAYPRHQARDDAWRAWLKLSPGDSLIAEIMAGLTALLPEYRARPPDKVPLPATFLNGGRWRDTPTPAHMNGGASPNGRPSTANHAGEDREYLLRGLPAPWGSKQGGIDSL